MAGDVLNRWVIGVDFGQRNDRTAVAAVELVPAAGPRPNLDLRWLQRLPKGMGYPQQCALLAAMVESTPEWDRADVIVDATGVGVAVADTLRDVMRRAFWSLTITGGSATQAVVDAAHHRASVPKRDLCSRLAVAMDQRRLRVAAGLDEAPALLAELEQFDATIGTGGVDTYGARYGHDDLVLATSYAVWFADRPSSAAAWSGFYRSLTPPELRRP